MFEKIALHGVPRSGTTWVGSIFDSSINVAYRHQPLFSYAFKSFLDESSSEFEINDFFSRIFDTNDPFITQKEEKEKGLIPSFIKEHITHIIYKEARYHNILFNLLEKDKDVKVVGIIRNPKSVIYSWQNAPKEYNNEEWEILKEWKKAPSKNKGEKHEFYGYNKWKETANIFFELKELYPKRMYIINYSNLLNDIENEVKKIFAFCNLKVEKQTLDFIMNKQKKDYSDQAYSVFRVNQNNEKWKGNLPNEIIQKIDKDLKGTKFEIYI